MEHTMGRYRVSAEAQHCIQECQECHWVCQETITHCLNMGGKHVEPKHIGILQDCVQICQTSADFMMRGSPFHGATCGLCAQICEACAADCERIMDPNDAQMAHCVEVCRRCAQSCREMAAMMAQ